MTELEEELTIKVRCLEDDCKAYNFTQHTLQEKIKELEALNEKMKCCENCKYNSYWGNELHCNYGLKEALQKDKLVECKNMDKWEIKENE